jgi:aryl-alcohol dehydrogenase-like predicted oxidoreductase
MEYRNLGKSGLKVSEICLGTLTFGKKTDKAESKRIVDLAFGAGVNFFDTADAYSGGVAEEYLGSALKNRRHESIVASKVFNPMGSGPNDGGCSRVHIMQAVEASLKRLNMDYLDIYYVHHTDVDTPIEETLRAMDDLVTQGKVRYIACSNHKTWLLMEGLWISDTRGWNRYVCYQPQYNLVVRDIEADLVPACEKKGLGIVAWGALAGGFLIGKYKRSKNQTNGSHPTDSWRGYWASNADETLEVLLDVAKELERTPAQVAIRWVLDQPLVSSVIVSARTIEQAADNFMSGGWHLPDEAMEKLNNVSELPKRYPEVTKKFFMNKRMSWIDMPSLE